MTIENKYESLFDTKKTVTEYLARKFIFAETIKDRDDAIELMGKAGMNFSDMDTEVNIFLEERKSRMGQARNTPRQFLYAE